MTWTDQEVEMIKEAYLKYHPDLKTLSEKMNRTIASIKCKATYLKIAKSQTLPEDQVALIVQHKDKSISAISEITGYTWNTVKKHLARLNMITVDRGSGHKWIPSDSDLEYLRANQNMAIKDLSDHFQKSTPTIRKKMREIGLKPPSYERSQTLKEKKPVNAPETITPRRPGENRILQALNRIKAQGF